MKVGDGHILTEFFPQLYHNLVRPRWFTEKYIHHYLQERFEFNNKTVLDFGSGTGVNCTLFAPESYMGVDPDQKRVMYSKKLYPNYAFHVLQEYSLPVENESIDYILIISVLHHISCPDIITYTKEFKRVLKPNGKVIAIEPCMYQHKPLCNLFMNWLDQGRFIRDEKAYMDLFHKNGYECDVLKRFTKCFVYNELFFSACLKSY
ncbi:class I SAM-dependent methyltransferase [Ectobacillus panaciterrae]|uniref:class I SAM-dependent methyltransferase n=1 Tax=Ectobacillus panaciterrae TaxID=363872 RepID=UPI00040E87A8|nr:class I SAM-dependent methyltransferase [Ectobacillus panaciterrae]